MHHKSFLFLHIFVFWIGASPLLVEALPEVLKITEGEGQNVKPLLEVDSEGRIWMAWQRDQGDDQSIYSSVYDGNAWSSEMVAMDYRKKESFDIAADGEGKVWIGWNAMCFDEGAAIIAGASYYWKEEWHSVGPDTIDVLQYQIDPWYAGSAKIFFSSGSLRMAILSTPPISYDLYTQTLEKLMNYGSVGWEIWPGPIRSLSQIGDENVWMVIDFEVDYGIFGGVEILSTAYFFSDGRWNSLTIDHGSYRGEFGPLCRYVSVKSVGSNSEDKVYVTCAVDDHPESQVDPNSSYEELITILNLHLEVWSFDANNGDTLSHWMLDDAEDSAITYSWQNDGIEVATTDESEIVGFAISRSGNTSLRALMDPVWYKPVSLENDSTVTSQHPSAVVDSLGNIWVAWDDGKDIYVSSVRLSDMEVDDTVTSVESDAEDGATTPAKFYLASNYPNPFNAATSIGYHLPFDTVVELSVYDLLGQKVRTLISGELKTGDHSTVWDGKNGSGRNTASGVYFYRLTMDGKEMTETKKMVLIR